MKIRPIPYLLIVLLFGLAVLQSCDDIIEPSISKSQVQLEAPTDQYASTSYTVNFWWDNVDHALTYHLQVVTPSFAAPGSLVLDTVVAGNKFAFNLNPGTYQWRVLAENGGSQTAYSPARTFTVVPASITQQSIQLSTPINNTITTLSAVQFQWNSLYGAISYSFELDTNNFADTSHLVYKTTIPGLQVSVNIPKIQKYEWRVQALNSSANSLWSTIYYFSLTSPPPGLVTLISPSKNQTVPLPVQLQWNAAASAVQYKLYAFKSDSTTTYSSTFPLTLNTTSYNFNFGNVGDVIYWKVSAINAAGVEGKASPLSSFVLNN